MTSARNLLIPPSTILATMSAGLPGLGSLRAVDRAFLLDQLGRNLVARNAHRAHIGHARGDVHRDVLAGLLVAAFELDRDADAAAAVQVRREPRRRLEPREKRRMLMFSPIFWTSAWRVASTLWPPSVSAESAATSAGFSSTMSLARPLANAMKSSLRATKSVSQLSSTIAAGLAVGGDGRADDTFGRDAVRGLGRLGAALDAQQLLRLARSPRVSVSAFLHSIMPSPVRSRSSITMLAVISAICCSSSSLLETTLGHTATICPLRPVTAPAWCVFRWSGVRIKQRGCCAPSLSAP